MDIGLPPRPVARAFESGIAVAGIAEAFGCDPQDVVDCIMQYYRGQGLSQDEVAERFGQHWGLAPSTPAE